MRPGALRLHRTGAARRAQRGLEAAVEAAPLPGPAVSFWEESLGPAARRPALAGDVDADVCIVGGGYTGLWTAWALRSPPPAAEVVVLEACRTGWGASGRNGGWLSGLMPGNRSRMARHPANREGVVALQRHLIESVDEVAKICAGWGADVGLRKGGTLTVATNRAQLNRLEAAVAADREWGLEPDDLHLLDRSGVTDRVSVAGAVGGAYSPHCARVHPARLVRALAAAAESCGAVVHEDSPAISWSRRGGDRFEVRTPGGRVRARWLVLATEGYTAGLPGRRRRLLPMNSTMVATRRLPDTFWDQVGWEGCETLADGAHVYSYLQRTPDGRIAIGGRGVPYRFGSSSGRAGASAAPPARVVGALEAQLRRMFPALPSDRLIEHAWSGVLGVARDWCPSVGVLREGRDAGLGWAGGYVGDGVTASYLAGRTLADLITGEETSRVSLPWVGHRSPNWEPEPLRWLGVRSVYRLYRHADRAESGGRPGGWAAGLADRVSGR